MILTLILQFGRGLGTGIWALDKTMDAAIGISDEHGIQRAKTEFTKMMLSPSRPFAIVKDIYEMFDDED